VQEDKILIKIDMDRWLSRLPIISLALLMRIHNGMALIRAADSIGISRKHAYTILGEIRASAAKFFGDSFDYKALS